MPRPVWPDEAQELIPTERLAMNTSEVLNRAADLIEIDGWHQGGYAPAQSKHRTPLAGRPSCTLGAIYKAQGAGVYWDADLACWNGLDDDPEATLAPNAVETYLDGAFIPHWNDRPGRTATEVIEVLRAAALIEGARETSRESAPATERESVSSS